MNSIFDKMIRAAKFDPALYRETRENPETISGVLMAVAISSAAAGLGSMARFGLSGIVFGTIAAVIKWFIWTYLVYILGARFLAGYKGSLTYWEIFRIIGFSSSPGVVRAIGIIPPLYPLGIIVANVWMIASMAKYVDITFEYSNMYRAAGLTILGWFLTGMATAVIGVALRGF